MAKLLEPTADTNLRLYLHAAAVEFCALLTAGQPPDLAAAMWLDLSGVVDALATGDEHLLHRYELPHDHPMAWPRGDVNDLLVLGADDSLTDGV
jgi:hypothetical protein